MTNVPRIRTDGNSLEAQLMYASRSGGLSEVKRLLNASVDVNCVDQGGMSPLLFACAAGHLEVVEVLLKYAADKSHKDDEGWDAYHIAMFYGDFRGIARPPFDKIMKLVSG